MADTDDTKVPATDSRSLLRDLAHELRDALSPVAASIDLLRVRRFEAESARTVAERVDRGLRRAFATLDSFLLAEQSERGSLELEPAPHAIAEILETAAGLLPGEVRERCSFGAEARVEWVMADLGRSAQVVQSVVQQLHAIVLSGTSIEVRALGGPPRVRAACRTEPQLAVGEDWFTTYRPSGGSMALRTARRVMQLQQGALDLAARDGACEFVLIFQPGTRPETQPAADGRPATGNSAAATPLTRVLIVDDSAEVRRAYREALLPLGYTVAEAADAEQALSCLERDGPQVALIDIHLPRINGYRLAQSMRARLGAAIRLVMLSGMTLDPTTRELSRQAGFDDCLDKMAGPLALHALLQGIQER